jgi:hypothetical protein
MNKKTTPADLFLGILALLLISVSFYQTWLGCSRFLARHHLSLPGSVITPPFSLLDAEKCQTGRQPTGSLVGFIFSLPPFASLPILMLCIQGL